MKIDRATSVPTAGGRYDMIGWEGYKNRAAERLWRKTLELHISEGVKRTKTHAQLQRTLCANASGLETVSVKVSSILTLAHAHAEKKSKIFPSEQNKKTPA